MLAVILLAGSFDFTETSVIKKLAFHDTLAFTSLTGLSFVGKRSFIHKQMFTDAKDTARVHKEHTGTTVTPCACNRKVIRV